jgi:hypothetical protein
MLGNKVEPFKTFDLIKVLKPILTLRNEALALTNC